MTSSFFSSTTIFDANTGSGVILREVSGQKLLIRMNPDNWTERNRMYDGICIRIRAETREIAGYKCIKAVGTDASRGYDHCLTIPGTSSPKTGNMIRLSGPWMGCRWNMS